jgi:hypothetical protein
MTDVTVFAVAAFVWDGRSFISGERLTVPTDVASRMVQEGLVGAPDNVAVPLSTWNTPAVMRR